jgi:hypothetical protein
MGLRASDRGDERAGRAVPGPEPTPLVILMPLYNDWAALPFLFERLDKALGGAGLPAEGSPPLRDDSRPAPIGWPARSQMSLVSLVLHGPGGIAVHGDVIGVRALLGTLVAIVARLIGIAVVAVIRLATTLAMPGWATYSTRSACWWRFSCTPSCSRSCSSA